MWLILETCFKNPENGIKKSKKLIFKNRLKHLKRKCFSVLRQKQSCLHEVKDGWKNLQHFSFKLLKPFCLSSEQGFKVFSNYKNLTTKPTFPGKLFYQ